MSQSRFSVSKCSKSALTVVAVAGLALAATTTNANPTFRVVAKTGDQAPGAGFASFTGLGIPSMSAEGEVAFAATLSSITNASGIWSEGGEGVGNLEMIAREGQAVPGGQPGWTYGQFEFAFFSPVTNGSGQSAFGARVLGPGLDEDTSVGIFRHSQGAVERVALPLLIAPGGGISSFFTSMSNLPVISENGEVAFRAQMQGIGVNETNDYGIWTGEPGALSLKAREGMAVPGLGGATLSTLSSSYPAINADGDIAFRAWIDDSGDIEWSTWRHDDGVLSMDVHSGMTLPWGVGWYGNSYSGFYGVSYNNADESVFWQTFQILQDTRDGVWIADALGDDDIATEGSAGPAGLDIEQIDSYGPRVDGAGNVIFRSVLSGPGVNLDNDSAIVRRFSNGTMQIVAREDQQAPGTPGGVVFRDMYLGGLSEFNENGEIVFFAGLSGPGVNNNNDTGIWVKRTNGLVELVVREGDQIEVSQGVLKQVSSLMFRTGQGPESGRRAGFNGLGQIAIHMTFADATSAVVVAQLPPTCPGDINGDGFVNITDLNLVLGNFGTSGNPGMPGDANLDGNVNITDLNLVLGNFGNVCLPV